MSYRRKKINQKIRGLRKKKKFFQYPLFWLFLLVVALGTGAVYLIFFLPMLQVSKIQISGNERIQTDQIESMTWNSINKHLLGLPYKSLLLASTGDISKNILENFAMVQSATVQKKMPDQVLITIKERKSYAVFCPGDDDCFSLDENGVIFGDAHSPGADDFVVVKSGSAGTKAGDQVIDKDVMDGIIRIQKNLQDELKISVRRVDVLTNLVFTTGEGWRVYFDANQNIQSQITKLDILLKDQISDTARQKLQYIYLQYKDRAYYK